MVCVATAISSLIPNGWAVLRLRAKRGKLELEISTRSIHRWVNSGGTFGANPLRQQIGVGDVTRIERVEISWPATGDRQVFEDLAVDRFYEITEGRAEIRTLDCRNFDFARASNRDHSEHR
jgi:hypothetical protein